MRVRKRKIKRTSRIKKKLPLILGLVAFWLLILALWYYLVSSSQAVPPPSLSLL